MSPDPSPARTLPADLRPSRAHRRFLRTLGALMLPQEAEAYQPVASLVLRSSLWRVLEQHLATAGEVRSGVLLGEHRGSALQITHLLPSGYPPALCAHDPLALDPGYVLGAVDAGRQGGAGPLDWVGHWVIPADGQAPALGWSLRLFRQAQRRALVGPDTPLLLAGQGAAGPVLRALVPDPDTREPSPLPISWATRQETPE